MADCVAGGTRHAFTCLIMVVSTQIYVLCDPSIDPTTPIEAYNITSTAYPSEGYDIVFSDEFNSDNRKFGAGNDPSWEAINSYNFNTGDFEARTHVNTLTRMNIYDVDCHLSL